MLKLELMLMWKERGQTKSVCSVTALLFPNLHTTSYKSRNQLSSCEAYQSVLTAVDAYCCGKADLLISFTGFINLDLIRKPICIKLQPRLLYYLGKYCYYYKSKNVNTRLVVSISQQNLV